MKFAVLLLLAVSLTASAQDQKDQKPTTLKGVLLEQLKTTHNVKDWFVPANTAVEGLTADQANWKDKSGNHSVGQLAYHLVFWNSQQLAKFKGEPNRNSAATTTKPSTNSTARSGPTPSNNSTPS